MAHIIKPIKREVPSWHRIQIENLPGYCSNTLANALKSQGKKLPQIKFKKHLTRGKK